MITLSSCTRNLDRAHATYILLTVKKQILSSMFLVFGAIGCAVADMKIETRMVITDRAARSDTQNPMMHRDIYYRRGMMHRKKQAIKSPGSLPAGYCRKIRRLPLAIVESAE